MVRSEVSLSLFEKVERDLCSVKNTASVLPLGLIGCAFAVFQELSKEERKDLGHIRYALYVTFDTDSFIAYDQFVTRCLNSNKSVDIYMADLCRLCMEWYLTMELHVHL